MEDKEENIQSLQQEQSEEEKIEEQLDETNNLDDKVVIIHMAEDKPPNEIEVKVKVDSQSKGEGKVKEREMESSSKKSKQSCKQNPRAKVTIPKPFSLTTDQKMSRERRVPMDISVIVKVSNPTLTKSASLNHRNVTGSSLGVEKTPDLRRAKSTRTTTTTRSLKPKVTSNEQGNKKPENSSKAKGTIQEKGVKKPQVTAKKQQEGNHELGSNKLQKSLSFKALPLPSFYHQKDPSPKQEINKNPGSNSKPTLVGQKGKTVARSEISKSGTEEIKGKRLSRMISSGAEGTLSKLLGSTTSSPKDMAKSVVSTA